MIKEVIVVEGKDDEAAVKRAVDAQILITHGFGISSKTWKKIEEAYRRCGIIIFTDPDHAGENIRRKLTERFPEAKVEVWNESILPNDSYERCVERLAAKQSIIVESYIKALEKVRTEQPPKEDLFSMADMVELGLSAGEGAGDRRGRLGEILGIGYGNTRTFLKRLNHYGVTEEEFAEALKKL